MGSRSERDQQCGLHDPSDVLGLDGGAIRGAYRALRWAIHAHLEPWAAVEGFALGLDHGGYRCDIAVGGADLAQAREWLAALGSGRSFGPIRIYLREASKS